MLESKQCISFWYVLDVYGYNSISILLRKFLRELNYLVMPEDSTDMTGRGDNESARFEARNLRSVIKVVFWIAISVAISVTIGQLR